MTPPTPPSPWQTPQRWLLAAAVPGAAAALMVVLAAAGCLQWLAAPFVVLADRLHAGMDEDRIWEQALGYLLLFWALLIGGSLTCLAVAGLKWWGRGRPV